MARYDTDGSSALAPNDPYNNMEGADIHPNFRVIDGGKSNRPNSSNIVDFNQAKQRAKDNSASKNLLRNSENSALSQKEPAFGSAWKNTVSGLSLGNNKNQKGNWLNNKKKSIAAMVVIIGLVAGGTVLLSSTHLGLGAAMSSILTASGDYRFPAMIAQFTNGKFFRSILNQSQGVNGKPLDLSDDFVKNLETFDIGVNQSGSGYTLEFEGQTINGDNFSQVFNENERFSTAFTNAKQGRVAGFYDTSAMTTKDHYGITNNTLHDFKETGNLETDTDEFNNTMGKQFENQSAEITTTRAETTTETVYDEESGKNIEIEKTENVPNDAASSATSTNADVDVATTKATEFIGKIGDVTQALNWSCTIMRTGNMVIKTASAMERIAAVAYFMAIMEGISKMMAGDGNSSGYNILMNFLVGSATSTFLDYNNAKASASYDNGAGTLSVEVDNTTIEGAPIQSNLTNLLAYLPINTDLAKNFSFDSMAMLFTAAFGFTTMKAAGCAITQIGESVASLAINLLPGGQGVRIVGGTLFKSIFKGIAIIGVGSIIGFLVPYIGQALFTNKWFSLSGTAAGEGAARGTFESLSTIARGAGLGFGTEEEAQEYSGAVQTALLIEAKADRLNRSPFDITSRNTFLGSIAHKLLATTLATNSYSAFTSLANTTAKSLASLTKGVYAAEASIDTGSNILNQDYDCEFTHMTSDDSDPDTGSRVAGSYWCTALPVTSKATLEISPDDPDFVDTINKELDSSGNIESNSDLAKTISYCFRRDSQISEIPDARILDELHSTPKILSIVGTFYSAINDVLSIINSFSDMVNIGWATGSKCLTHPNKDKYKAYVMQETLYEQMMSDSSGLAYVSPVTTYVNKYNAEHPINSTTDLLARHAGLTDEDTELVIALAEYYNFLDEYEPDTRIALDAHTNQILSGEEYIAKLSDEKLNFASPNPENILAIIPQFIIYTDVRNRSYAV